MKIIFLSIAICVCSFVNAQITYPYPTKFIHFTIENQKADMAFMDVKSEKPNGQTVILLHGKNFNGYYWKDVIPFLTAKGYRVIVPDQVGWGKSSKPNIHYSFQLLASNTKQLLDSLGINKVIVLAHSMGGMLATRFVLMFPEKVSKLIMENPIGLEDYKTFIPYRSIDKSFASEIKATYESYKKYMQSYFPAWKPEYDQYVDAQAASLKDSNFAATAMANAITYEMIYEQPIVYELKNIAVPTLLIIGQADRTVVGKDQLTEEQKKVYGNYPELGRKTQQLIKGSQLVELPGVGHIPHIQEPDQFKNAVINFLNKTH
jgi:pimeloyl-ACP methyl ester carboxylesterase